MGKYDEAVDEVRSCIVDKKNPKNCIDKVMDEYGFNENQKEKILIKVVREELD